MKRDALKSADKAINSAKKLLDELGVEYRLDEWLTVKKYCEKFNIKDTQKVTNWISRGIIPAENVRIIDELNGLKLIKAVQYMQNQEA